MLVFVPITSPMWCNGPEQPLDDFKDELSFLVWRSETETLTIHKKCSPGYKNKAIGITFAGQTANIVCKELDVSRARFGLWLKHARPARARHGMVNKTGLGQTAGLKRVSTRVVAVAAEKRHQSTWKLAQRPTVDGKSIYLSWFIMIFAISGPVRIKSAEKVKINEKYRKNLFKIAIYRYKGSEYNFNRGIGSGKPLSLLIYAPNQQNCRV